MLSALFVDERLDRDPVGRDRNTTFILDPLCQVRQPREDRAFLVGNGVEHLDAATAARLRDFGP